MEKSMLALIFNTKSKSDIAPIRWDRLFPAALLAGCALVFSACTQAPSSRGSAGGRPRALGGYTFLDAARNQALVGHSHRALALLLQSLRREPAARPRALRLFTHLEYSQIQNALHCGNFPKAIISLNRYRFVVRKLGRVSATVGPRRLPGLAYSRQRARAWRGELTTMLIQRADQARKNAYNFVWWDDSKLEQRAVHLANLAYTFYPRRLTTAQVKKIQRIAHIAKSNLLGLLYDNQMAMDRLLCRQMRARSRPAGWGAGQLRQSGAAFASR